jgi:hypothetical protein
MKPQINNWMEGISEGKRLYGRPRCRWEDNIRMNLKEIGWRIWTEITCLRLETS